MTDRPAKHPGLNLGPAHPDAQADAEPVMFGMWVFVMSDLVIFGLLLATYITTLNPMAMAGGPGPLELFDLHNAFIETLLLLTSSLTFGMATLAVKHDRGLREIVAWIVGTMLLGVGFLTLELIEFATMFAQSATPQRSGFLSAFFVLVPMHGLHLAFGLLWMVVMLIQFKVLGLRDRVKTRMIRLGLFWHFLAIVWVGIVSVVYLAGLVQ